MSKLFKKPKSPPSAAAIAKADADLRASEEQAVRRRQKAFGGGLLGGGGFFNETQLGTLLGGNRGSSAR